MASSVELKLVLTADSSGLVGVLRTAAGELRTFVAASDSSGAQSGQAVQQTTAAVQALGSTAMTAGAQVAEGLQVAETASRRLAETEEETTARIRAMVQASVAAREEFGGIEQSQRALAERSSMSAEQIQELHNQLEASANSSERMRERVEALNAAETKRAASATQATTATRDEGAELAKLLGQIDPTVASLGRLDEMERRLAAARRSGSIGADDYAVYSARINQARDALTGAGAAAGHFSLNTAAARREMGVLVGEIARGDLGALQGSITTLANRTGLLSALLTPLGIGIGLVTAALVGLGAATVIGETGVGRLNAQIVATGNFAGVTATGVLDMGTRIGSTTGRVGAARDALASLVATGKVTGEQLEIAGRAAVDFATVTGQSADEAAKALARIADDPLRAVTQLNEQYHFLDATTLQHIRTLDEQGRATEAASVAFQAFGKTFAQRAAEVTENLGSIERSWNAVRNAASNAWDRMLNIGRPETVADLREQMTAAEQALSVAQANASRTRVTGVSWLDSMFSGAEQERVQIAAEQVEAIGKKLSASLAKEAHAASAAITAQEQAAAAAATARLDTLMDRYDKTAAKQKALAQAAQDLYEIHRGGGQLPPGINFDGAAADVPQGPGWERLKAQILDTGKATKQVAAELRAASNAVDALANYADSLATRMGGPLDEAYAKYEQSLERSNQLAEKALIDGASWEQVEGDLARARANAAAVLDEEIDKVAEQSDVVADAIEQMEAEIAERGKSAAALKAEQVVRDAIAKQKRLFNTELDPKEIENLRAQATARAQLQEAYGYVDRQRESLEVLQAELQAGTELTPVMQAEIDIRKLGLDEIGAETEKRRALAKQIREQASDTQRLQATQNISRTLDGGLDQMSSSLLNGASAWSAFSDAAQSSLRSILGELRNVQAANDETVSGVGDWEAAMNSLGQAAEVVLPKIAQVAGQAVGGGGEGAAIGSALGAIVGSFFAAYGGNYWGPLIGGAIGGMFDNEREYTARISTAPDEWNTTGPFGAINTGQSGDDQVWGLQDRIRDFDRAVADTLPPELVDAVTARMSTFSAEAGNLEDLLRTRFAAMLEAMPEAVGAFVGQFSSDLQTQVQALSDVMQLSRMEEAGTLLSGSLDDVLALVTEYGRAGERVAETYMRLTTDANNYRAALALSGQGTQEITRALVEQAADIAQAAGGTQHANELWTTYFENFYSDSERAAQQLEFARERSASSLEAIGLSADTTMEQFRTAFEEVLKTGTPEEIARWLEAASAMSAVGHAMSEYADFVADLLRESGRLSDFDLDLDAITRWEEEATDRANELARAAGLQGAAESDLALIRNIATDRTIAAIRKLRQEISDLSSQLGYTDTTNAAAANDALYDWGNAAVDQTNRVRDAQRQLYEAQLSGIKSIEDYLVSMQFGDLSGLTPEAQLAEARAQLEALQARALGGDAEAMSALPQMAQTFLQLLRGSEASGGDFNAGYDWVRALLQSVVERGPTIADPGETAIGGGGLTRGDLAERDQRLAAQDEVNRQELALQLTQHLGDLAEALKVPVLELAETMHVPLERLATDLGINLETITGASVQALANMATQLGLPLGELVQGLGLTLPDLKSGLVELTKSLGIDLTALTGTTAGQLADLAGSLGTNLKTLSESLGVDLGKLTDIDSPIFLALKDNIGELSPDIREELDPLLKAVGDASSDEAKNEAVKALRDHVDEMAPSIKNQLAPYFEDIVPVDAADQLAYLRDTADSTADIARTLVDARNKLGDIAIFLRDANHAADVPGYATGTGYVPSTGLALLHEAEAVIPAPFAAWMRQNGFPVSGRASNDDPRLVLAFDGLRAEMAELRRENRDAQAKIAALIDAGNVQGSYQLSDIARTLQNQQTGRSF